MSEQETPPVSKHSTLSRRLKITGAGVGWPRPDAPYLRLRGRWLEHAGFVIGRQVKVEVSEGRLTIEQVD